MMIKRRFNSILSHNSLLVSIFQSCLGSYSCFTDCINFCVLELISLEILMAIIESERMDE